MGPSCKETCENCPGSICDIDGKCVDQISKCEGGNYYGQKCENDCNSNCFECNRQGECISCPENKSWGKNCDKSCANCIGGTCNFEDGICDKASDICAGSVNYGENCNIPCNTEDRPNCLKCYKESGNYFQCQGSYFGNDCDQPCDNCKCTIKGICNGEGEKCINNKLTGEKCDTSCKIAINSKCEECTIGNDPKCTKCEPSFYGDNCSYQCDKCPGKACDMEGKCINENDQCEDKEYTGDMCIIPCKDVTNLKCKECGRDEKCTKCEPPFSKEDCSEKCEKCPNGECYINGICIDETSDCENPGYKGPSCETPCNDDGKENCEKCHRNGECISDDEIIETQEDEIVKSTEEINICLSLINFGSLENSDNNISLNINITEDINTKCKDFYKTNKIFE